MPMSRRSFAVVAVITVLLSACSDDTPNAPSGATGATAPLFSVAQAPEQVVGGDVVVKLRAGADVSAVQRAHGLTIGEGGYPGAFVVLRGAAGREHANAAALRADARVEWAEPNFLRQPTAIDNRLWAFYNPGGLTIRFTRGS